MELDRPAMLATESTRHQTCDVKALIGSKIHSALLVTIDLERAQSLKMFPFNSVHP